MFLVDQLAGHWAEKVVVKSTGLPPPNVEGYHTQGLIPHISDLIERGVWVKHPYNMGECWTGPSQEYITMGSYQSKEESQHISKLLKMHCSSSKTAFFEEWTSKYVRGYLFDFEASTDNHIVPQNTSDEELLERFVIPWMKNNEDWSFVYIHLDDHDYTGRKTIFVPHPTFPIEDKHHHLVDHVDLNVGRTISFLEKEGWWNEVFFILCSDHAYHLGCDIDPPKGLSRNTDFNWSHGPPYDCHIWDFKANKPSERLSQCCRRITMILNGGALDEKLLGKQIETSEIIEIPATIADMYSLPHHGEGESILKKPFIN